MFSIKVLVGDVEYVKGKKVRNITNGILIVIAVCFTFFVILAYATHNMGIFRLKTTMFWSFIIVFSLLSHIFLFSICVLMRALREVG